MSIRLTPLSECIANMTASATEEKIRSAERIEKNLTENIKTLERNRMVIPAIMAIVGENAMDSWYDGRDLIINLGMRPVKGRHKKEEFRKVFAQLRTVLGQLPLYYKDTSNVEKARKGIALFMHTVKDYPGIQIRYEAKVPKGAKCKIVREVSYRVLCEA